jgi:UDP-GlcNAc:undecaprenyl-phosphate GlcNAc-1-phosphate transferase
MGDTGSLTIGFILAALSMGTSYTQANNTGLFAPLLILAIPMYDTFLVMYLRWRKGISPFLGSKDHFALRLEKIGYNRKQILMIAYSASTILAFGAFSMTRLSLAWSVSVLAFFIIVALLVSYELGKVKIE